MLYFTSDLHLGHKNIIKYCDRPFSSVEEMDAALINNWNSVVKPTDTVVVVGDFAFATPEGWKDYLSRLNGDVILIVGNHDYRHLDKVSHLFKEVHTLWEVPPSKFGVKSGPRVVCCHYAMRIWPNSHRGAYHLYGHSHGTIEHTSYGKSMDVGVDAHNFTPVSYYDVDKVLRNRPVAEIDYHVATKILGDSQK